MDTYSAVLLAALAALAISAAGWVIARRGQRRAAARYAIFGAVLALAFDVLAVGIHWTSDHASGTPSALSPLAFFSAHPVTVAIAAAAAVLLWLSRKTG